MKVQRRIGSKPLAKPLSTQFLHCTMGPKELNSNNQHQSFTWCNLVVTYITLIAMNINYWLIAQVVAVASANIFANISELIFVFVIDFITPFNHNSH